MITEQAVRDVLKTVRYPGYNRDIVSFGLVKNIQVENASDVRVHMAFSTKDPTIAETIEKGARAALQAMPGVGSIDIDIRLQQPPDSPAAQSAVGRSSIPGVKRIIAVASGKGGVGKSTISANLAIALAASGASVGLCDCDLYGPSMAQMFGSDDQPYANESDQIVPIEKHGIKLMSMGFLLSDDAPVIVRGPMATRYTQQFLRQVAWGELDYLVLDLPPGTGDIQLTIVQTVALDGAVIVTTPQEVALIDARKAVAMFDKVNVPILGLVENMSWFECPSDGKRYYLFGRDGGVTEAYRLHVPMLAQIPLTEETRIHADEGHPVALHGANHANGAVFHKMAVAVKEALQRVAVIA